MNRYVGEETEMGRHMPEEIYAQEKKYSLRGGRGKDFNEEVTLNGD